jgi:hypothetical protein
MLALRCKECSAGDPHATGAAMPDQDFACERLSAEIRTLCYGPREARSCPTDRRGGKFASLIPLRRWAKNPINLR